MFNIMKLEMKKFNLNKCIRNSLICTLAIILLTIPVIETGIVRTYSELFNGVDLIANGIFLIFEAALIGEFIIKEFNNKTITVLFTYPISRKKILMAKLALVITITFLSIFTSTFVSKFIIIIYNFYIEFTIEKLTLNFIIISTLKSSIIAIITACISLITIHFGMKKKSVSTTIVSSVTIYILLNAEIGGKSMEQLGILDLLIKILLAVIGILIAYFNIRKIEKLDF